MTRRPCWWSRQYNHFSKRKLLFLTTWPSTWLPWRHLEVQNIESKIKGKGSLCRFESASGSWIPIELFCLYVFFPQYKSCDNTLKSCFDQISSHSSAYLRIIYEKTKGQDPLGPLLGKQYIQAKEVYLDVMMRLIDSLIEEGKPVKPTVCWDKFSHVHMGKQCKTGWYYPRGSYFHIWAT